MDSPRLRRDSFTNYCERKRRTPEYKRFIDRAVLIILLSIFSVLIVQFVSSAAVILIYGKISVVTSNDNCSCQIPTVTSSVASVVVATTVATWNLSSPLERTLNCSDGRKIPVDLTGSRTSEYFLYLCDKKSSTAYQKLILLNSSDSIEKAASFTWTDLDFIREYCVYCVHSVAYCGQMLKLKFYTNPDSVDCYYSYSISSIFVCLNQKQEVTRGNIGGANIFNLSRRELFQFCDIIEYWF